MKRLFFAVSILAMLTLGQFAHAVYLDSSWYAQLTNVNMASQGGVGPFCGAPYNSTNIKVTSATNDSATFTISQSCEAQVNETAKWYAFTYAPWNYFGPISFDYQTYWTEPNMVLQLWTHSYDPFDPDRVVWSSSAMGLQTGHVDIDYTGNGYAFKLVAVPEPSSLFALGSLCGILPFGLIRRRSKAGGMSR